MDWVDIPLDDNNSCNSSPPDASHQLARIEALSNSIRDLDSFNQDIDRFLLEMNCDSQDSVQWGFCEICCSRGLLADRLPCKHKYCTACVYMYMRTKVTDGSCELTCPWPECRYRFQPSQIMRKLDTEMREQYLNLTLRKALAQSNETRYCPGTNCGFAVFVEPAVVLRCGPVITCRDPRCGVQFCYYCKELWHPTRICASARTKFPGIKKCPRCGIHVMKRDDGSCNQMRCTACEHEFCWLCLEKFTSSHFPFSCPAFGKTAYSRKRRLLNRIVFGVTLPVTLPITVAVASGFVATNMALVIAAGSLCTPVIIAKRINRYLKTKSISSTKRKAAVAGGTSLAIVALPALAPWGIYHSIRWVHNKIQDALNEVWTELDAEELREIHTKSLAEARADAAQSDPANQPGTRNSAVQAAMRRSLIMEPSGGEDQDEIVAVKAADIPHERCCDDEFVVKWRRGGYKLE